MYCDSLKEKAVFGTSPHHPHMPQTSKNCSNQSWFNLLLLAMCYIIFVLEHFYLPRQSR